MRVVRIALAGFIVAILAAGATAAVLGITRSVAFEKESSALARHWNQDVTDGVSPAQLQPLRRQLDESQFQRSSWWSPVWWTQSGLTVIDRLSRSTDTIWAGDVSAARSEAQRWVTAWEQLQAQLGQYVPTSASTSAKAWPAQLESASTPATLMHYASAWEHLVQAARQQALGAQLSAQVARLGGVQALLDQAQSVEQAAHHLNLDDEGIGALATALRAQEIAGDDASATTAKLVAALGAFHQLLALNNNVAGTLRPIMLSVDQAAAEGTPDSQSLLAEYRSLSGALAAAREPSQLSALAQQLSTLQGAVGAELTNDQCGHSVPSGRVITVNLTLQEAVFYQDGCVVQATPVTTGRALLRTPTGTFHVFYKQSPFQFISPWPKSSPFYYFPSWVSWVMEFDAGGYFLHDAPWEPAWQYGPGSEDSSGASHGCIHIPTPVMQWLYTWTPMGAPVIVTG